MPAATPAATPLAQPAAPAPAPSSWQVSYLIRCAPAPGVWYYYSGSLAQAQAIYDEYNPLYGQPVPGQSGCVYGSVTQVQQVTN